MPKEKSKVPIIRILLNDYIALLPVLFAVVLWIMYLVLLMGWDIPDLRVGGKGVQSEDAFIMLWIALAVSLPGLMLFLWRVRLIRKVFAEGIVVEGEIIRLKRIRRRGLQTSARVKFRYSYEGKEFVGSNWLLSWDLEKDEGDCLELVVLADRPGRALIREVYEGE